MGFTPGGGDGGRLGFGRGELEVLEGPGTGFLDRTGKEPRRQRGAARLPSGQRVGAAREGQGRASTQGRLCDGVSHGEQTRHREALRPERPAKKKRMKIDLAPVLRTSGCATEAHNGYGNNAKQVWQEI